MYRSQAATLGVTISSCATPIPSPPIAAEDPRACQEAEPVATQACTQAACPASASMSAGLRSFYIYVCVMYGP